MIALAIQEDDDPPPGGKKIPFRKANRNRLHEGLKPRKKAKILPLGKMPETDEEVVAEIAKLASLPHPLEGYVEVPSLDPTLPALAAGAATKERDDSYFLGQWLECGTPVKYTTPIYTRDKSENHPDDWVEVVDQLGRKEKYFAPKRFFKMKRQKGVHTLGSIKLPHGYIAVPDSVRRTDSIREVVRSSRTGETMDIPFRSYGGVRMLSTDWAPSFTALDINRYMDPSQSVYRATLKRKAWKRHLASKRQKKKTGQDQQQPEFGHMMPLRDVAWLCQNPDGVGLLGPEPTNVSFSEFSALNHDHELLVFDVVQHMEQSQVGLEYHTTLEKQLIPPVELKQENPDEYRKRRRYANVVRAEHRRDLNKGVSEIADYFRESIAAELDTSSAGPQPVQEAVVDDLPWGEEIQAQKYEAQVEYMPGAVASIKAKEETPEPSTRKRSMGGWELQHVKRDNPDLVINRPLKRLRPEDLAEMVKPSTLKGMATVSPDGTVSMESPKGTFVNIEMEAISEKFNAETDGGWEKLNTAIDVLQDILDPLYAMRNHAAVMRGEPLADEILSTVSEMMTDEYLDSTPKASMRTMCLGDIDRLEFYRPTLMEEYMHRRQAAGTNRWAGPNFRKMIETAESLKDDGVIMAEIRLETLAAIKKHEQRVLFAQTHAAYLAWKERKEKLPLEQRRLARMALKSRSRQYLADHEHRYRMEKLPSKEQILDGIEEEIQFLERLGARGRVRREQLRVHMRKEAIRNLPKMVGTVAKASLSKLKQFFSRKRHEPPIPESNPPTVGEAPIETPRNQIVQIVGAQVRITPTIEFVPRIEIPEISEAALDCLPFQDARRIMERMHELEADGIPRDELILANQKMHKIYKEPMIKKINRHRGSRNALLEEILAA